MSTKPPAKPSAKPPVKPLAESAKPPVRKPVRRPVNLDSVEPPSQKIEPDPDTSEEEEKYAPERKEKEKEREKEEDAFSKYRDLEGSDSDTGDASSDSDQDSEDQTNEKVKARRETEKIKAKEIEKAKEKMKQSQIQNQKRNQKALNTKKIKAPNLGPAQLIKAVQNQTALKSDDDDDLVSKQVIQVLASPSGCLLTEPHRIFTGGRQSTGTAFYISDHCLITCYHVVRNASELKILDQGSPVTVHVVTVNPTVDLALLWTTRKGVAMRVAPETEVLRSGDNFTGHGFPLGHPNLKKTAGILSGWEGYMCQTSVPSNPGSSGGPLVAAKTGNVVAITASGILRASNVAFGVPAFYVRQHVSCTLAMLSEKVNERIESRWEKGFRPEQLDKYAKRYVEKMEQEKESKLRGYERMPTTLLVDTPRWDMLFQKATRDDMQLRNLKKYDPGIIVNVVIPGGPFDKCGIESGDMLLFIDGSPIDAFGMFAPKSRIVIMDSPRIRLDFYVKNHLPGDVIKVKYNPMGEAGKVHEVDYRLMADKDFPTRPVYWLTEEIDYEIFAGVIFEETTESLLEGEDFEMRQNADVLEKLTLKAAHEPSVTVVKVLAGAYLSCKRLLMPGDVIDTVNSIKVKSLEDLRAAIASEIAQKTPAFQFKTMMPRYATVSVRTIRTQENKLALQNGYKPSELYEMLDAAFKNEPESNEPVEDCARAT